MQRKISTNTYKNLLHLLSHDINNILQDAIYSLEKLASAAENAPSVNKRQINTLVLNLTKNIYSIRDLCFGYSHFFDFSLTKHAKILEGAYNKKIDICGDVNQVAQSLEYIANIALYLLDKQSNLKVDVTKDSVSLGVFKNAQNILPNLQSHLNKIIHCLESPIAIYATNNHIVLSEKEHE